MFAFAFALDSACCAFAVSFGVTGTKLRSAPTGTQVTATPLAASSNAPDASDVLNGLPTWLLTAGTNSLVQCWDFDKPLASYTVAGLDPGESRQVYQPTECLPYAAFEDARFAGNGLAGAVRGGEASAAAGYGDHYRTYAGEDGLGMYARKEHLKHRAPMAIMCQQPRHLDSADLAGGAFVGVPSPASQVCLFRGETAVWECLNRALSCHAACVVMPSSFPAHANS